MPVSLAVAALASAGAAALVARPLACLQALVRARLSLAGVRSRRALAGGVSFHILERPGADPPVVLLHGLGTEAALWFPLLPRLLPGRRLTAPSLPAHGRSSAPAAPFGVAEIARCVGEWLEAEARGKSLDLVGFSLGGWVALHLALAHPRLIRRLALVSSAGAHYEPPPARRLFAPVTVEDLRALLEVLAPIPLPVPRFVLRDLLRRARPERRCLVDSILRGEGLLDGQLGQVRAPTLVVWGGEDRLVSPAVGRRLAAEIPGARGVEFPGSGHTLYWERRRELRALLEAFLR